MTTTPEHAGAVRPSAYLKFWLDDGRPRCRVDLTDVCEPWLDALNPEIVPLYRGDEMNAALTASEARVLELVWPDDVLDRVEEWINRKCGGEATVREIAAALIAARSALNATSPGMGEVKE